MEFLGMVSPGELNVGPIDSKKMPASSAPPGNLPVSDDVAVIYYHN